MAGVNFDFSGIEKQIETSAMNRLEGAAKIVRDKAKSILANQIKGGWQEHGPYLTYRQKKTGKISAIIPGNYAWTARHYGDMIKTIRTHRDDDQKNIWIIAGNRLTWWAVQLEYGRGKWKGGPKPFLRPALANSASEIKGYLEGGAIGGREA